MITINTHLIVATFSTTQQLLDTFLPPLDGDDNPITYTTEEKWDVIRLARNGLIEQTDWAMLPDSCNRTFKASVVTYRQTLRDLTTTYATPEAVVFPAAPSGSSSLSPSYVLPDAYTVTNLTPDRTINVDSTTVDKVADVIGTFIKEYQVP